MNLRGEFLLRDFKIFVERGLSQAFNGKVSIGDVKGGLFYPITFSDIVLYSSFDERHRLLESEDVSINYHLWDIVFNRKKHVYKIRLKSPKFFVVRDEEHETESIPLQHLVMAFDNKADPFSTQHITFDIIDGSIIRPDTRDPVVRDAHGRITLFKGIADLENLTLNLYGVPLNIDGRVDGLYAEAPNFDIDIEFQSDYAKITAHIEGVSQQLMTQGKLEAVNGINASFSGLCELNNGRFNLKDTTLGDALEIKEGHIDFSQKEFCFKLLPQEGQDGEAVIGGNFFPPPNVFLYAELKHWTIGGQDVVTNIKLEAELSQKKKAFLLTGALDTANTIINYRPSRELSLQFALRKKAIEILGLKWGKSFRLVGKLELEPPYNIEGIALLDGARLDELASFGGKNLENVVAGIVKGKLEIEGPLANPVSRGHITSRDGKIGDIYYRNAVIHLIGKGPLITIGDSRIYKETGYLILSGEIDFRKFGKRNIFEDIIVRSDDQTIVWDGWDITKESATDEVSLKKRIGKDLEVGFKASLESEDRLQRQEKEAGEVELKYKIRDHESLKMQIKEEEEFLGVEHKIKF